MRFAAAKESLDIIWLELQRGVARIARTLVKPKLEASSGLKDAIKDGGICSRLA